MKKKKKIQVLVVFGNAEQERIDINCNLPIQYKYIYFGQRQDIESITFLTRGRRKRRGNLSILNETECERKFTQLGLSYS